MTIMCPSRISAVWPLWAVEGGRLTITSTGFTVDPVLPQVTIGGVAARLASASSTLLTATVPAGLNGGHTAVRIADAPGETAYVVLAPEPGTVEQQEAQAAQAPWYSQLWGSVQEADRPPSPPTR